MCGRSHGRKARGVYDTTLPSVAVLGLMYGCPHGRKARGCLSRAGMRAICSGVQDAPALRHDIAFGGGMRANRGASFVMR